jgi:hypothetical protein
LRQAGFNAIPAAIMPSLRAARGQAAAKEFGSMLKKLVLMSALPLTLLAAVQPAEARRLFWWETLNPDTPPPGYYDPQQDAYFDPYGEGYDPAQERFNRRQYELYRREMARRYGNAAYYEDQGAYPGYGYDVPSPPYADPVYPRSKKAAKPKSATAKPAAKISTKPKAVNTASNTTSATAGGLTTASTTTPATPAKPGSISCDKGQGIVSSFGFSNVASKSCAAKTLVYTAERGGNRFEVEVNSASGELTAVKKL